MLVMMKRVRQSTQSVRDDEAGVALVIVVVLMFLGAVVVSAIAMMVITTIESNSDNTHNTQSFVTAESWRDTAVGAIASGINAGGGNLTCTSGFAVPGSDVVNGNGASVKWVTVTAAGGPDTWTSIPAGTDACPQPTSNYVVIHSVGTAGGKKSEIDSAYIWSRQPDTRPAGTLAYFDGQFTATKSTYQGDLVIRGTGAYQCNNGAGNEIQGDLWVTNASVVATSDCYVTGSIYAYGSVSAKNNNLHVGGDIITQTGDIDLEQDAVTVGGQIYAGHDVILTKSGTVGHLGTAAECAALTPAKPAGCLIGGTVKAVRAVTSPIPAGWKDATGAAVVGLPGQPTPTFDPTLVAVHDATAWLELDTTKNLSADSQIYTSTTTPSACSAAGLASILGTSGIRAFIDTTGCASGGAGSSVTIKPDAATQVRDALVYVPPTSTMKLTVGPVTNGNTTLNGGKGPELLFVHGDANVGDSQPTCTTNADQISVPSTPAVRTMIYSACGINSTIAITMTGQLYAGTLGIHLNGGTFTCAAMGWDPAFKNLACGVKGDDGIFDPSRTTQLIGALTRQTE